MEDSERALTRLETVRAVEPLVSAMRNISMGSWQRALRRRVEVQSHRERLHAVLHLVLPHLPRPGRLSEKGVKQSDRIVLIIVGTERGLVGQFNRSLAQRTVQYHADGAARGLRTESWSLGTRLTRVLKRDSHPATIWHALPGGSLPPYPLALDLTRFLLAEYEAAQLSHADVLFQHQTSGGRHEPTMVRLIPPDLRPDRSAPRRETWPPPIIETDPLGLYARLVEQLTACTLYDCLVESAVAEHSARFQLMEEASQNATQLIEELTWSIQAARRQAITREMQELVVGAGLLGSP
jgi:F-type H+-transporting ATPase subunit gamma